MNVERLRVKLLDKFDTDHLVLLQVNTLGGNF